MSTKTASRSAGAEREHHRTSLWAQLARFIGLFLSPMIGLFAAWLIHVWVSGIHIHHGPVNWDVNTSPAIPTVAVCLVTLTTVVVAWFGWQFAEHRKPSLRGALAGSIVTVGLLFAINVGTGPSFAWSPLFFFTCGAVAMIWTVARLDVTRNDKQVEQQEDGFLEKHGLKGWKVRKVVPIADEKGEPLATRIDFQHAEGDTVDQLYAARPAFESGTRSPADLSQVNPDGRADRSSITVMHRDPLIEGFELPEFAYVGRSIMHPICMGKHHNGSWEMVYLAGGRGFSPTGYMFMGMSRAGKTYGENIMISDGVISRRDAVVLYLNKAKGMQDIRPILPGVEAALLDDSEGSGPYRQALQQVKRILSYRQRQLALFNIHEWNAEQCWDNPPWRTDDETGKRVRMERMPALVVHVGEADAIISDAMSECIYVMSKGLSVGILPGWSLQRAAATRMPTDLRANIGAVWCYGCDNADSATMALSDWVVKAGAHPENWKARKPGYHYFEGPGIDEELFVVPARTPKSGPGGTDLREELLRRNTENAPLMAKLDRGSADATGAPGEVSWWDQLAASTEVLRRKLLSQPTPGESANMTASDHPANREFADGDGDAEDVRKEMREEMEETTEVEGVELYPPDPDTGVRATFADGERPLPPKLGPEDELSWEDPKPPPRDRPAALAAVRRALAELIDDESLRDPADPTGCTVIVTAKLILDRYEFRSRPFFSACFKDMAAGELEIGHGLALSPAPDLGPTAGKYRLQRPHAGHAG